MKRPLRSIAAGLMVLGVVVSGRAPEAAQNVSSAPRPAATAAEVQALRERAAAYWAARMEGDDKGQWQLLEPRGQGRLTPREYASERGGLRYLGYQIEDATIEGFFATVKVRLLFQPILPRLAVAPQTVLMDDRWIRVGGAWYRQLDDRRPQKVEP